MTEPQRSGVVGSGVVVGPDDGEVLRAGPVLHRVVEDGRATDGRLGLVECRMPAGWPGPPQHVHRAHDETFFVLTGRVRITSGAATHVLPAGGMFAAGIGTPHTFGNADPRGAGVVAAHRDTRALRRLFPGAAAVAPPRGWPARSRGDPRPDVSLRH